jgi:phage shock protein PspC (stress-responsive transcriptional regulator)
MDSFPEDSQQHGEQNDYRQAGTTGEQADTAAEHPGTTHEQPPLRRPAHGRVLAGVAAALGQHFNVDVTIVRVAFGVLTVLGFTSLAYFAFIPLYLGGIPLYLACWVLIPEEGTDQSIAGRLLTSRQHRPG